MLSGMGLRRSGVEAAREGADGPARGPGHVYVHVYMYIYIYIYTYNTTYMFMYYVYVYMCVYIYIYIYTCTGSRPHGQPVGDPDLPRRPAGAPEGIV